MKLTLFYKREDRWEQFSCEPCGSLEFTRYDPKDSARYRCVGCQAIWYGSKAEAVPIPGTETGGVEDSMAYELKKRVTRGICALAGCSAKDGLYAVRVEGRKEQVDICEPHAMEVVEVDASNEPWIPLSKLAPKEAKPPAPSPAAPAPEAPAASPATPPPPPSNDGRWYWTGNEYKPNPDFKEPEAAHAKAEEADALGAPDAAAIRAQADAVAPPTKEAPAVAPVSVPAAPNPNEIVVSASVNHAEIQTEASDAAGLLAELDKTTISSEGELTLFSEILADVKGRNNRLEALKQSATKPLNEALATIRSWFRPAQDQYARVEIAIKRKIAEYYDHLKSERAKATAALNDVATSEEVTQALGVLEQTQKPEVAGLQIREVWDFEIVDADQLPRLYLMPNEKVIRAQIALGVREIPGVRVFVRQQVASKAS